MTIEDNFREKINGVLLGLSFKLANLKACQLDLEPKHTLVSSRTASFTEELGRVLPWILLYIILTSSEDISRPKD